jgi:hypothetical protein
MMELVTWSMARVSVYYSFNAFFVDTGPMPPPSDDDVTFLVICRSMVDDNGVGNLVKGEG